MEPLERQAQPCFLSCAASISPRSMENDYLLWLPRWRCWTRNWPLTTSFLA